MVGPSLNSHNLTLKPIKFLCSYGGRILPRYPDGKLRYHGGETRVLSVERSISFAELLVKLGEMCGTTVSLRCQLPTEDLDALVSITSDEDLANLIEEYDRAAAAAPSSSLKIRAFLSAPKRTKKSSSPPSSASSSSNDSTSPKSPFYAAAASGIPPRCPTSVSGRCIRHAPRPPVYPIIGGGGLFFFLLFFRDLVAKNWRKILRLLCNQMLPAILLNEDLKKMNDDETLATLEKLKKAPSSSATYLELLDMATAGNQ